MGETQHHELAADEWLVGAARRNITPDPDEPHHLIGLRERDGPMDGIEHDIHARAIVLESPSGRRLVVLSFELIAVSGSLRATLEEAVAEQWGVEPEALLLNPSHNHYGPDYYRADEDHVDAYRDFLVEQLLDAVGAAVEDREPASLAYHSARCAVAINRRYPDEDNVRMDPDPDGPVDHDLPVLVARNRDGAEKAILFGYACHPTVGTGYNRLMGDWPGYAMELLEEEYGVPVGFLIGAAGDQRAYPQGTLEYVKRHARTVATAVERALVTDPRPVRGPLKLAADAVGLDIDVPVENDDGEEVGREVSEHRRYPIQAFGFGTDLTVLSLTGEICAETSLRLKDTLASPLWVAGYANSAGYLATDRILAEGGYEAQGSGTTGRYAYGSADLVRTKAEALAKRAGARRRDTSPCGYRRE